jgi:hypothetical protein
MKASQRGALPCTWVLGVGPRRTTTPPTGLAFEEPVPPAGDPYSAYRLASRAIFGAPPELRLVRGTEKADLQRPVGQGIIIAL